MARLTLAALLAMDLDDAVDAVADVLASRPDVLLRIAEKLPRSTPTTSGAPVLMTRKGYAARVGYSVRFLDGALDASCFAGEGRRRRVVVERADARLRGVLARPRDEGEGDEIERLAVANARRRSA